MGKQIDRDMVLRQLAKVAFCKANDGVRLVLEEGDLQKVERGENIEELIDEMKTKVPDFMVPNVFVQVEQLPINKNGKTDRNMLKEQYYSAKAK